MSQIAVRLVDAVEWRPDLAGSYPGQRCYLELGRERVRLEFCWCPPTPPDQPFLMGSPPDEAGRSSDELQREVAIPKGFWLARHPVNQRQWQAVMGSNPSRRGNGDSHPVDSVSWNDAREFCEKAGLRLPKEAEWEYACRAGTNTPFGIGGGLSLNAQAANFDGNFPYGNEREAFKWVYRERTVEQGSFPPNAWGLYDMHGQLWEWCDDPFEGRGRVLRGGSWIGSGWDARSALRRGFVREGRLGRLGFRPCPSSIRSPAQSVAGGRGATAERARE